MAVHLFTYACALAWFSCLLVSVTVFVYLCAFPCACLFVSLSVLASAFPHQPEEDSNKRHPGKRQGGDFRDAHCVCLERKVYFGPCHEIRLLSVVPTPFPGACQKLYILGLLPGKQDVNVRVAHIGQAVEQAIPFDSC